MNNDTFSLKSALLLIVAVVTAAIPAIAQNTGSYHLFSPDSTIRIDISVQHDIQYSVYYDKSKVIDSGMASLDISGRNVLPPSPSAADVQKSSNDEWVEPVVALKHRRIRDRYNQITLSFDGSYSLQFRAYEEGVAYRHSLSLDERLEIQDELVSFQFSGDYRILFPQESSLQSHYERLYKDTTLAGLTEGSFSSLPTTLQTPTGITLSISDADLFDYPNMFLEYAGNRSLRGKFPKKVVEAKSTSDRNQKITQKADFIADIQGDRTLPWRAIKINRNASQLLENNLYYLLSRSNQLENSNWIAPGKVAWDWWHARNMHKVPFEAGINTQTYKHYIDFASEQGLEFVILDEGWSHTTKLLDVNPDIDIPELVEYADQREVGLILWMLWKPLRDNMERYFSQFEEWGIRGLKIDFMQRADQDMVQFYERAARRAAEHRLLINFHGSYKPSGLRRAYPNVLTYEGVKGLENSKWSDVITPDHDVALPFTRMTAGPMDYTPGAMVNAHTDNFRAIFTRPMSQGTRAHQVAMYIIYESGLQMLADSPTHYRQEPETTDFISRIPVTWDQTLALEASLAEHATIARRKENTWYIGAMTGQNEYSTQIKLSFLDPGQSYRVMILKDGINADRYAEDYVIEQKEVQQDDSLAIDMVSGGGWAAILKPIR